MTNEQLAALTAIVNRETAILNHDARKYGEFQWDPNSPAVRALDAELQRLGVIR